MDAGNDESSGPILNNVPYVSFAYFVLFIFVGSMFLLNLFIGILFLNYKLAEKKSKNNYLTDP